VGLHKNHGGLVGYYLLATLFKAAGHAQPEMVIVGQPQKQLSESRYIGYYKQVGQDIFLLENEVLYGMNYLLSTGLLVCPLQIRLALNSASHVS